MKRLKFLNKIFWLLVALSASAVVFNSCDDDNEPGGGGNDCGEESTVTANPGVVINGVKWATANVDVPGTFALTPESPGKFYQWNRRVAWCATVPSIDEPMPNWNNTTSTGTTWTRANDPSPAGWRVPTFAEVQSLLDIEKVRYEWTTQNSVNGGKFTDRVTGNSIFLPAIGARDDDFGLLLYVGMFGRYWSSTQSNTFQAYYLEVGSYGAYDEYRHRLDGYSVRSVSAE